MKYLPAMSAAIVALVAFFVSFWLPLPAAQLLIVISLVVSFFLLLKCYDSLHALGWLFICGSTLLLWRYAISLPSLNSFTMVYIASLITCLIGSILILNSTPYFKITTSALSCSTKDRKIGFGLHFICALLLFLPQGHLCALMFFKHIYQGCSDFIDSHLRNSIRFHLAMGLVTLIVLVLATIFIGWVLAPIILAFYCICCLVAAVNSLRGKTHEFSVSLSNASLWPCKQSTKNDSN